MFCIDASDYDLVSDPCIINWCQGFIGFSLTKIENTLFAYNEDSTHSKH